MVIAKQQTYNQTDAKRYANFSGIAHCSKKQIEQWNCKQCKMSPHLSQIIHIENLPAQISGFVAYDEISNQIILSWRGTIDVVNWYEDFNFEFLKYQACRDCQIHAGFYESYMSVHNIVLDKVSKLVSEHNSSSIVVTGHSLGGALATISALTLRKQFASKTIKLYPMGCPRVGNVNLAHFIKKQLSLIMRVVHNRDIVPHLPPESLGYFHTPFEVFYDQNMAKFKVCDDTGQDKTCSNKYVPDYSFADHDFYWMRMDNSIC